MMQSELPTSLSETARKIARGSLSLVDLISSCHERIRTLDGDLRAMTTVDFDGSMQAAVAAAAEVSEGRSRGFLHGVPIVVKDIADVCGLPTRAGSSTTPSSPCAKDADLVARLRNAGAIILGKAATWEFAMGETDESGDFPPSRNPHNTSLSAGGSSSGSAVAVAARYCSVAVGSDTGGSIRCPAAWCGVVGFKPTLYAWPMDGFIPLAKSMDCPGFFTSTAEDMQALLVSLTGEAGPAPLATGLAGRRFFTWNQDQRAAWDLAPDVEAAFEDALARLRDAGVSVTERCLPDIERFDWAAVTISRREGFLNHREHFADEVWRAKLSAGARAKLEVGRGITEADLLEAYRQRQALATTFGPTLGQYDALLMPTMHCVAPPRDTAADDALKDRPLAIRLANLLGLPSLSVPCASNAFGLPSGLCLTAPMGRDAELLQIATLVERVLAMTVAPQLARTGTQS